MLLCLLRHIANKAIHTYLLTFCFDLKAKTALKIYGVELGAMHVRGVQLERR